MKFSENLNLPILQDGDKYSKEIQNEAFNTIDKECTNIKNTIKSALDINDDVIGSIKTLGDISEELSDINSQLDNIVHNAVKKTDIEPLHSAFDRLNSDTLTVFIPQGNYEITRPLDFTSKKLTKIRIYSEGSGTTIVCNNTSGLVCSDVWSDNMVEELIIQQIIIAS